MPHPVPATAAPSPAHLPPRRHAPATIALHWATLAALLVAVAAVLLRDVVEGDARRALLLAWHRQAALTVLVLLALRLAARAAGGLRTGPAAGPWLRRAAVAGHLALYLGLLAVPLLGSALSDARGQHTAWLGWLPLPHLAATDPDLADTLEDLHAWAAWALGGLVLLHAGAALWHHRVRRDDVLAAMWPVPLTLRHGAAGPGAPAAPTTSTSSTTSARSAMSAPSALRSNTFQP